MSTSLAKKRRANLPTPPPSPVPLNTSSQPLNNPTGGERKPMTLPQVLSILEKRLVALEKSSMNKPVSEATVTSSATFTSVDSIKETLDEYETRFDMLAEQINYLKDTVMKLQTFTMDVNKTLLDERVQIMREQNSPIVFSDILEKVEKEDDEEEEDE
jgi:hypothetical protein